jgi:hypothetical protein
VTDALDEQITALERAIIRLDAPSARPSSSGLSARDVGIIEAVSAAVAEVLPGLLAKQLLPVLRDVSEMRKALGEIQARGIFYEGVWQPPVAYCRGAVTTLDGALWVAARNTLPTERPGKSDAWQLARKSPSASKRS